MDAMTLRIPGLPTPRALSGRHEAARQLFAQVARDCHGADGVTIEHEPGHHPWPLLRFTLGESVAIALLDDDGVIRVGASYGGAANADPLPLPFDWDAGAFAPGSAVDMFRAALALLRDPHAGRA